MNLKQNMSFTVSEIMLHACACVKPSSTLSEYVTPCLVGCFNLWCGGFGIFG